MFSWSFKHKPYKPLSFSSAELAICVLPSLYESVTLDSLDKLIILVTFSNYIISLPKALLRHLATCSLLL